MNLGQWPDKRALLHPRRPFLSWQGRDYDNQAFAALIGHAAQGLLDAGLTRGDRLALLMGNSPAFLQLFFACARIGAVLVPLNPGLAAPELAQVIRHCRPRLVMHSPSFAAVLEEIERHLPLPCPRLQHGDHAIPDAFAASQEELSPPPWPVEENDPLLLIYTSTSALPPAPWWWRRSFISVPWGPRSCRCSTPAARWC
jgi:fatty-acyl-CoA synthase